MIQSPQPDQNKSCGRSHIAVAARLCLISLIPFLCLAVVVHVGEGSESGNLTPVLFFWSIVLFILGVALWEVVDLIRNKGLCCCRKGRILVTASLCLTPWIWDFTWCAMAPGLVVPLFHNWIVMVILGTSALWQVLGFILLIRAKSSMRSFLVILFFILSANSVLGSFL